jgi:hypothetical protein
MKPVRRLLVGLSILGVLTSASLAEAKADAATNPVGRVMYLLNAVGSGLTTDCLQPPDIKTMINIWPGLLDSAGGSNGPLTLPLVTAGRGQPDCLGRTNRFITLREAIEIALQKGPIDGRSPECFLAPDSGVDSCDSSSATYTLRVDGRSFARAGMPASRGLFEQQVQLLTLNVELAYWNLQYAYWDVYAQEQGLRQAYAAWKLAKSKYDAGRGTIAEIREVPSFGALCFVGTSNAVVEHASGPQALAKPG